MPRFGKQSKENVSECHQDLQDVLNEAINHYDFSCIEGHRNQGKQNHYFSIGTSTVKWPNSKHNSQPSRAADCIPYPDGFDAEDSTFYEMATHILGAASRVGVRLKWGGHWKNFKDLAHFELMD